LKPTGKHLPPTISTSFVQWERAIFDSPPPQLRDPYTDLMKLRIYITTSRTGTRMQNSGAYVDLGGLGNRQFDG